MDVWTSSLKNDIIGKYKIEESFTSYMEYSLLVRDLC